MNKHEKYVLLLVVLFALGNIGAIGINTYLAYAGQELSQEVMALLLKLPLALGVFANIAAVIWLYLEAKAMSLNPWVWAALGLFFGILGVILFYSIQIYTKSLTSHSSGTPNGAP